MTLITGGRSRSLWRTTSKILGTKKRRHGESPVTPQKFWHTEGQSQNLRVCDTLRVTKNIVVADASMNNCMTIFEQS